MRSRSPEGPARALRPPADRLAGRRRARGRAPSASSSSTGPSGALDGRLPEGVEIAVQPRADGTGDAVARPRASTSTRDGTVRRPQRRRAADHAPRRSRALVERARRRPAPRRRWRRWSSTTRPATAASCATPTAASSGSSRPRPPGDATPEELAIREVNTGIYAFDGAALLDALAALGTDNAQGELYLPDVAAAAARRRRDASPPTSSTTRRSLLGVNDRVELARGPRARPARASIERAHARRRDDRRPRLDRRSTSTSRSARDTVDRAVDATCAARRAIGARCRDRPAARRSSTPTLGDGVDGPRTPTSTSASVDDGASVGPFAYLRPGAHLRERREGRHVRRDQELRHRRGHEGPAPLLHRRRRRRRGHEPRRRQRSPPTTTAAASTARRSAPTSRTGVDTSFVAPVDGRRRRLHRRRVGDHRGRPGRRARHRARAPDATSRATPSARSASRERLPPPRVVHSATPMSALTPAPHAAHQPRRSTTTSG